MRPAPVKIEEQKIKAPQVDGFGRGEPKRDVRDLGVDGVAGVAYCVRGDVHSVRQARHKLFPPSILRSTCSKDVLSLRSDSFFLDCCPTSFLRRCPTSPAFLRT